MTTITQTTKGQLKQIIRFTCDAVEKVLEELGLDSVGAQRVIEHGDVFARAVREAATTSLKDLSVTDKYRNEEVESSYGYLSGYEKPRQIAEQVEILRGIFPKIGSIDESLAEGELPKHAEGWFAIPKWQTIAPTYAEAVQKVLECLKTARNGKFYNYREGQIVNERLRQGAKTEAMFQKLAESQKDHNILVIPAQFGLRHRGRSVRRAREVMSINECGLGAFAVGIMILTHPERLSHFDDLWIDCTGDEFDLPVSCVRFGCAPYFRFHDGKVKFDTYYVGLAHGSYGSASGFGSQS